MADGSGSFRRGSLFPEGLDFTGVLDQDNFFEGRQMKWAKERDNLIAQTRAFVQSVIGGRPEKSSPPGGPLHPIPLHPIAIENTFAAAPPALPDALEKPEHPQPLEALPTAELPSTRGSVQHEVREEIQSRVAAFQAHQQRFEQERETYFKLVLSKARSGIGGKDDEPSS